MIFYKKMFFLIAGGDRSVKRIIQSSVGPCIEPSCCGSVDIVEMGSTLYLFFLPVWTFKSEERAFCRRCGFLSTPSNYQIMLSQREHLGLIKSCVKCGKVVSNSWAFCPGCGTQAA